MHGPPLAADPHLRIRALRQPSKGKADAVFARFKRSDMLVILDSDRTTPPEQLPKFWQAIRSAKVLRRSDYLRLRAERSYFGNFDPFGDFDLSSAHQSSD